MRIYELNPILDSDILGSQVLALDDSTQTRKISLDQIRVFLGVGEDSTLIPSGTDIHVYFLTAKSGSYYGEGLINTAQGGAWAAFDWSTHEGERGTLTETNNVNELAVHSLAAGAWTKKKIISEAGGKFLGKITIELDSEVLTLKNKTTGNSLYFTGVNPDGTRRFYIGCGSNGSEKLEIVNEFSDARIDFNQDGSISIAPTNDAGMVVNDHIRLNTIDGAGSFAGQYDTKAPIYQEFTDAGTSVFHPLWKQKDLHNKNMWAGGVLVSAGDFTVCYTDDTGATRQFKFNKNGEFYPASFANFDARYMEAGEAYTKAQSDAKYLQMPSAGGVGDVALVRSTNGSQYLHGASVPGSALQYAGLYTETDGNDPDIRTETKTLSGTWRITGTMVNPPTNYPMRATTAIRIA